ncbi:MAG: hypothetical protein HY901_31810 [Deltaproteobacteria bacterium]|nr:hypothetical protein [Deltaproteobacteria bacterium]
MASPTACEPGGLRCNGTDVEICNAAKAWEFKTACTRCSNGACSAQVCTPMATRCGSENKAAEACLPDGSGWSVIEVCELGCSNGVCSTSGVVICTGGDKRCNGDAVEACTASGTAWGFVQFCVTGCDGATKTCKAPTCVPYSGRCSPTSSAHELCNSTGTGFTAAPCSASETCINGTCQATICTPGQSRCMDAVTLGRCNGAGTSFDSTPCSANEVCQTGTCSPVVCAPYSTKCKNAGTAQVCNPTGTAWLELECGSTATCQNGVCAPQNGAACQAGTQRCLDAMTLATCAQDGSGYVYSACEASQVCSNAACKAVVCAPGSTQCQDAAAEGVCNPLGTGFTRVVCSGGTACDPSAGACAPVVCTTGATHCADVATLATCNATGTGYTASGCAASEVCSGRACKPVICAAGSTSCVDSSTLSMCNSDGTGRNTSECGPSSVCSSGQCKSVVCGQGATYCEDSSTVGTCNGEGTGFTFSACSAGSVCSAGACLPLVCAPNSATCADALHSVICNGTGTASTTNECSSVGQVCLNGICQSSGGNVICVHGAYHCNGSDIEQCNPSGTGWVYVQSCTGECNNGICAGTACAPFTLTIDQSQLPADNSSTTLVSSSVIKDLDGHAVPDGTLFTVSAGSNTGGVLSSDADAVTAGTQVASLNGRIDFLVKAGTASTAGQSATVTATTLQASRCAGTATLNLVTAGTNGFFSEDFTRTAYEDLVTTSMWDTYLGQANFPLTSGLGNGEDGDLIVRSGTFNINTDINPANLTRAFPDAVSYSVAAFVGTSGVTVTGIPVGIVPGDEVLLINLQGGGGFPVANANNAGVGVTGNVGHYEIFTVQSVDFQTSRITFASPIAKIYGASTDNTTLTGQKIVVQRIPHYGNVTVNGTLTANAWDGSKGGLFFIKAKGALVVNSGGQLSMSSKGYRMNNGNWGTGESYSGPPVGGTTCYNNNGGGGVGSDGGNCYYGSGGGYGERGTACVAGIRNNGGFSYGDANLTDWFMGSAGGNWGGEAAGFRGGGILVAWASAIGIVGNVRSNGDGGPNLGSGSSAGGSVYLRATNVNIGQGLVTASGGYNSTHGGHGAVGRIRIDAQSVHAGDTTSPTFVAGGALSGGSKIVTVTLDNTPGTITKARIVSVIQDTRGGTILYEMTSNGGTNWNTFIPGDPLQSFSTAASDLRLRITLTSDGSNLPLGVQGITVEYLAP